MRTRSSSEDRVEGGSRSGRKRGAAAVRSAVAGAAGVLLVIGASTIGLHDWADAQLDGVAAHGSTAAGTDEA